MIKMNAVDDDDDDMIIIMAEMIVLTLIVDNVSMKVFSVSSASVHASE